MIQQFTSALCFVIIVSHSATSQYKLSLRVCFQSSTMSNFLDQLYEVLLRRTPLNTRPRRFARLHDLSTMSNSIDQLSVNNVELHRQPTLCMPSPAMSNSIYRQSSVNNVELRHGELSSCATYTLSTCNLLPRGLVPRPIQRKSKVFKSNF